MITNICLLLEALSIIVCLHCLYGEKFKLEIITVSFLSIYMIIMASINYYELPQIYTMIIHPIITIYCGIRFGFKLRTIIINSFLYLIIIGAIQLLISLPCYYILKLNILSEIGLLWANCVALVIVFFILPRFQLYRLSSYLQDKERILKIALLISLAVTMFCIFRYKKVNTIDLNQAVLVFVCIMFICVLAVQLARYKIKSKEVETELKMHQLYEDSFHRLIEDIRLRQHEFDNHINTIYSLHYTYKTYETLVKAQKEYSQIVITENRYNKILTSGNPLVIGFLYSQFLECEKLGIDVTYKVNIRNLEIGVPTFKIVEILGNLIKNAIEALITLEGDRELYVSIVETDKEFELEVRNKSRFLDYSEIESFFRKGFSKKGNNRGLGLYNVKSICTEYQLTLFCFNKEMCNRNWLCFSVKKIYDK